MSQHQLINSSDGDDSLWNNERACLKSSSADSLQISPSTNINGANAPQQCVAKNAAIHLHTDSQGEVSDASIVDATFNAETMQSLLLLPAPWFGKDKAELLRELGRLSQDDLLSVIGHLLDQGDPSGLALPSDAQGNTATFLGTKTDVNVSPEDSDIEPDYTTTDLMRRCRIGRAGVTKRVRKLVRLGELPERCTKPWIFDAEEAEIVVRGGVARRHRLRLQSRRK